jgi:hypothetical protein
MLILNFRSHNDCAWKWVYVVEKLDNGTTATHGYLESSHSHLIPDHQLSPPSPFGISRDLCQGRSATVWVTALVDRRSPLKGSRAETVG